MGAMMTLLLPYRVPVKPSENKLSNVSMTEKEEHRQTRAATRRQQGVKGTAEVAARREEPPKRKAEPQEEVPRKRRRLFSISKTPPAEGMVENGRRRGFKKKDRDPPNKKIRAPYYLTNSSDGIMVPVRPHRRKEARVEQPDNPVPQLEVGGGAYRPPPTIQENIPLPGGTRRDLEERYVELAKFGEGGYGCVYAGRRRRDQLAVAIKHIPQALVERQLVILERKKLMIPKEVRFMMQVSSSAAQPSVISLLDWYDLDEEVLLVMERPVPSVDLREYVDSNGPQEEDMVKSIMKQLVEASIHMHSAGVFHRDLKLDNVLIHPGVSGPRVRIIDFGCGCATQKEPHRFYYSGTTAYAPPEVFSCGAYHDGPTTVWHLGAIMYEMLDGQEDFSTVSFLRSPIKVNNKLSRRCRALLKACWVTDPEKRVTLQQMRQHAWLK